MNVLSFSVHFLFFVGCFLLPQLPLVKVPQQTSQIVLVTSEKWTSPTGTMRMFFRQDDKWVQVGGAVPVTLGRNGMGWGRGLQAVPGKGPEKIEGDGRAPAGIFAFGTAFGYSPEAPIGAKLRYREATTRDFYVDDPESPQYNQWVVLPKTVSDPHELWHSFEKMKRADHLYEVGIVVEQNVSPVVMNRGSAVFFHVWREAGAPTAGCTAMSKENLLTLLRWLDPTKNPLLIQIPENERVEWKPPAGGRID